MLKNTGLILLLVVVLAVCIWNMMQCADIAKKVNSLNSVIAKLNGQGKAISGESEGGKKGYDLTVDMWQIFEKELQDYKQRLREGKSQFSEQQSTWSKTLAELKKTIQEYDKFMAAEGEFWEKQLKNYDKMLAQISGQFNALDQVVIDLQNMFADIQQRDIEQKAVLEEIEQKETIIQEEAAVGGRIRQITPEIRGRGGYKTYPGPEEELPKEVTPGGEVIKGTITGRGDYKTY